MQAVHYSSASAEWYTPADLMEEIGFFLGKIDLDPCPPKGKEGLAIPWRGRVFLNPPYGREIGIWVKRALTEPLDEIVMLLPARTDTTWFAPLFQHTLCFLSGRLRFSGHKNTAPFPSVLVYRGARPEIFAEAFKHRGYVVKAW